MNNSGRENFKKYKKIIYLITKILDIFSKNYQVRIFNKINKGESKFKLVLRYAILKNVCSKCGDNIFVGEYVTIKNMHQLSLGDNVSIHKNCYIDALGEIVIGNDVSIATDSKLISFNHGYEDEKVPIKYNELKLGKIEISNDVWLGANSIILANVKIASRVIVAAGSVVTKNLDGNSIYGGIPSTIIKKIN